MSVLQDPMVAGKKVEGIFAFCDIRNFTDTTECLQERIMTYVNQVGHIVHTCAHRNGGAANKNVGDGTRHSLPVPLHLFLFKHCPRVCCVFLSVILIDG
jgi:class 3 adenylate cyclase